MKVLFYSFAKRNKSTARPTDPNPIELDVNLKDGTNITKPVLLLQTLDNIWNCNYAYIAKWNRYYFISESKTVDHMWEVALTEDYLASFKSDIGSTTAMVLYASNSNENIVDTRIPVKASFLRGYDSATITDNDVPVLNDDATSWILGITGKGSFGPYLLQINYQIRELLDGIDTFKASNLQDMVSIGQQLFYGGSAAQCLKSAIAIPWTIPQSSVGSLENLYLGAYPCEDAQGNPIQAYPINDAVFSYNTVINIPWQSNDWQRVSQYTSIVLYLPLIGLISLNATDMKNDSSLNVYYAVNATSGDFSVDVSGVQSGVIFYTGSGCCAANLPYGNTGIDTNKLVSGAVKGIGTAIAMGVTSAAMFGASTSMELAMGAAIAGTAGSTIMALAGDGSGNAGMGGGAACGLDTDIKIWVIQKELAHPQSNYAPIIGKPYMGSASINNFAGYVQTDGFQLATNWAYSSERDMVNKLLDTGIYYE